MLSRLFALGNMHRSKESESKADLVDHVVVVDFMWPKSAVVDADIVEVRSVLATTIEQKHMCWRYAINTSELRTDHFSIQVQAIHSSG